MKVKLSLYFVRPSIADPNLKFKNFASIYGIIKEIRYVKAWKTKSCSWCKKFNNFLEETIRDPNQEEETSDEEVNDEFKSEWGTPESTLGTIADEVVDGFPEIQFDEDKNQKISGFGIRGMDK
mgnify:CR=1 FL=1